RRNQQRPDWHHKVGSPCEINEKHQLSTCFEDAVKGKDATSNVLTASEPDCSFVGIKAINAVLLRRHVNCPARDKLFIQRCPERQCLSLVAGKIRNGFRSQMLGPVYTALPFPACGRPFHGFRSDSYGMTAVEVGFLSLDEIHFGRADKTGHEKICRPPIEFK